MRLLTHSSFAVVEGRARRRSPTQTGYKVKLVQPGDAGVMVNEAILRKDHPVADALFGVDNTFLTRALDAGIFDPYVAHGLDTVPAALQVDPAAPGHADRPQRRLRRLRHVVVRPRRPPARAGTRSTT